MAGESYDSLHILSLVINRLQDIPLIRAKVKLLAGAVDFPRLAITRLATAASEMARLLAMKYGGGTVALSLARTFDERERTGLAMVFEGRRACLVHGDEAAQNDCPLSGEELLNLGPVRGARAVLDSVFLLQGGEGLPATIICLNWGIPHSWEELQQIAGKTRKELFVDTEESYLENFKVKHEEVLKLLREKSIRTRELDQVNAELMLMTQNMEALAREKTMAEMALKVADRIRNPATVIGGIANLLIGKKAAGERAEKHLAVIREQAVKLEQAVADFERLAVRADKLFYRENLLDLVNEALGLCVTLTRKKIRPVVLPPPEEMAVRANRPSLKMGLLNTFRFVARAMVPGSEMPVRLENVEGRPSLIVSFRPGPGAEGEQRSQSEFSLNLARLIVAEHHGELTMTAADDDPSLKILTVSFPLFWEEAVSVE
ncbi:MAG: hypothetical protein ACOY4H_09505 [Thermodesulfobacteriota bacterium]